MPKILSATNGVRLVDVTGGKSVELAAAEKGKLDALKTAATHDVPAADNAGAAECVLGNDTRLSDARTPTEHSHAALDTLGTAATHDVPATGNAGATECVLGNDTRLSDAREPTEHSHASPLPALSESGTALETTKTITPAAAGTLALGTKGESGKPFLEACVNVLRLMGPTPSDHQGIQANPGNSGAAAPYTLPLSFPLTTDQMLMCDHDGQMYWADPPTGGGGSKFSNDNQQMLANATMGDGQLACSTAIAATPLGAVQVFVGPAGGGMLRVPVSNSASSGGCYFSGDNGATARGSDAIQAGDKLFWIGSAAGFDLDGDDRIDFVYLVAA